MTLIEFKNILDVLLQKMIKDKITTLDITEDQISQCRRIIDLIEEDVIVKTENENVFVEDISLNGILNNFAEGHGIIKLSEV